MASQEDLNNSEQQLSLEQEILGVLARRLGINSSILTNQQDISNVLGDQLKVLKGQQAEKRLIRSVTTELNRLARENYGTGVETLGNDKARKKVNQDIAKIEANIRLLKQQQKKFAKDANELTGVEAQLAADIAIAIGEQVEESADFLINLKGIRDLSEETADNFGTKMFGGLAGIAAMIPGFNKFSKPFEQAAESSRQASADLAVGLKTGKGLTAEKIKELGLTRKAGGLTGTAAAARLKKTMGPLSKTMVTLRAGFKALAPLLKTVLAPLALLSSFSTANKEIVELKKGLSLNNSEAVKFRNSLAETADNTANVNVTASKMLETFTALNKQFGFITNFSNETLATMTRLTNVVGVSAESAGNLAAASSLTGKSFEENYKDVLATSRELQVQNGVQVDLRDVLEQTGKVTGQVRANLGSNPALIARAITQAKMFGAELDDIVGASKALLDFESSIESELQAELLIGRNLNLERARAAALSGDQVTLAQELQKQAGNFTEFSSMNVIQQEALASAMGMQADQLADILMKQEMQGKTAKELRALGKDELADRLESQTAAESFTATMEKLQAVVVDVVAAFAPILDIVSMVASAIAKIISMLGPLKGVLGGAAAGAAFGPVGAGIGAVLGGISSLITMDDGIIPANYGDTIVRKGKGTIALNNNDTVVAGTNLNQGSQDTKRTNMLLEKLITQNASKPQLSPVGLYEVQ